jgi:hypothetical protein
MKTQPSMTTSLFLGFVSLFVVTMTMAFLMVPYALSGHPGDAAQNSVSTESRHLT